MGWQPSYQSETQIYAKWLLKNKPDAKIAVLFQNDDYGKDYLKGLKDGLGAKAASMIVAEESYETSEPTIDSHIVRLKSTGADVFMNITTPKFAAQAIKKVAEVGWKPLHFLNNVSGSVGSVLKPAGFENAQDIISADYLKDISDPQWNNDPGMKDFVAFMNKYFPEGDKLDHGTIVGYGVAQTLVQILKQCGDDLTRENVIRQAASLKNFRTEVLLPGIQINTSADRFCADQPAPARAVQGREVGSVRRRDQRRRRRLAACKTRRQSAPCEISQGVFAIAPIMITRLHNRMMVKPAYPFAPDALGKGMATFSPQL